MKYNMRKPCKTTNFALSKCFIAPSAMDFPMPPQHWMAPPANEFCTIEASATNYVNTSTSYKINELFSYHMKAMVNIEISANKLVNSTFVSTEINCKVSYNMQMNVNLKTCNELERINSMNSKVISNVNSGIKNSTFIKNMFKLQTCKQTEEVTTTCEDLKGAKKKPKKNSKLNMKTCKELEAINNSLNNTSIIISYEEFEGLLLWLSKSSKQNSKTCRESERFHSQNKPFNLPNIMA